MAKLICLGGYYMLRFLNCTFCYIPSSLKSNQHATAGLSQVSYVCEHFQLLTPNN